MKTTLFMTMGAIALSVLSACNEELACTMEFRTVTVEINGPALSSYYTLNRGTGDTIRIGQENIAGTGVYPILDDSYQTTLAGRSEQFRFEGWINDSLVVQADYVIAADHCHIDYVSGPLQINL